MSKTATAESERIARIIRDSHKKLAASMDTEGATQQVMAGFAPLHLVAEFAEFAVFSQECEQAAFRSVRSGRLMIFT